VKGRGAGEAWAQTALDAWGGVENRDATSLVQRLRAEAKLGESNRVYVQGMIMP
jgi:dipeptidyl aminopeptidase/acylaminoacyl peptidase